MYKSFVSLGRYIPKYFILFVAMVNGIVSLISLFTSTGRLLARSLTSFQCPRVKLRGVVSFCPMLGGRGKQKYTERLTKQTHEMQTRSRAVQTWRQTENNNSDGSGH